MRNGTPRGIRTPLRAGARTRRSLIARVSRPTAGLALASSASAPPQVRSRIRPVPECTGNQGLGGLSAYCIASIRGQTEQSPTTSPTTLRVCAWCAGRDSRAAFGCEGFATRSVARNLRPSGSKRDPNRDFIEEIRFLAKIRVNPDRFPDPR
jgi:hypothetical protein